MGEFHLTCASLGQPRASFRPVQQTFCLFLHGNGSSFVLLSSSWIVIIIIYYEIFGKGSKNIKMACLTWRNNTVRRKDNFPEVHGHDPGTSLEER